MSTRRRDKSTLPDPSYHWTSLKAQVFIGALGNLGRVSEAAAAVGMSRNSAYRLRERLGEGSLFARSWDRALEHGRAQRRAPKVTRPAPESDIFGIGK